MQKRKIEILVLVGFVVVSFLVFLVSRGYRGGSAGAIPGQSITNAGTSTIVAVGSNGIQALPANPKRTGLTVCLIAPNTLTAYMSVQIAYASSSILAGPVGVAVLSSSTGNCYNMDTNHPLTAPVFLISNVAASGTVSEF